jgi:hypothetical protein
MIGDLIVKKTGIGQDKWPEAEATVLYGGALEIKVPGPTGMTLHLYSAGAWLEVSYGGEE